MIRTTLNSDEVLANVQNHFDDGRHADDVSNPLNTGLDDWKDIGEFPFGCSDANRGLVCLDWLRIGIYGAGTVRV